MSIETTAAGTRSNDDIGSITPFTPIAFVHTCKVDSRRPTEEMKKSMINGVSKQEWKCRLAVPLRGDWCLAAWRLQS